MSSTKSIDTYVEVDLGEWDDEDLIEELTDRGYSVGDRKSTRLNSSHT